METTLKDLLLYGILALFSSGVGVAIMGFTIRAYIDSVINPKLYRKNGESHFVSQKTCDKVTEVYHKKVCNELSELRESQKDIAEFANALKGYYAAKGVKFP